MKRILLIINLLFLQVYSTSLSGDISGIQFNDTSTPYIIENDIFIPEGKTVVLKEGVVFLFSQFTGLQVDGNLFVLGKENKHVIFSSVNDSEYMKKTNQPAAPFDWNGIIISTKSKNVELTNFILRYSVYGIKSQNPDISILNGTFYQNGQFHFTINDKIEPVNENSSFCYNSFKIAEPEKKLNNSVIRGDNKPVVTKEPKNSRIKFLCLGIGCAGVIAGTVGGLTLNDSWQNLIESSQKPDKYKYYSKAKSRYYGRVILTSGGALLAVLGFTGFVITLRF